MNNINRLVCWLVVFQFYFGIKLIAQDIQISAPIDLKYDTDYKIIGQFDTTTLICKQTNNSTFVQSFGNDLQELASQKIDLNEGNNTTVLKTIAHKNKFQILYSYYKKGTNYIYIKTFSSKIVETSNQLILEYKTFYSNPLVIITKNKKQLLLSYIANNQTNFISFDLINNKTNWTKEIEKTKAKEFFHKSNTLINDEGMVFYFRSSPLFSTKKTTLAIYQIDKEGNTKTDSILINFDAIDFEAQYDEANQQLALVGFYGSSKERGYQGLFHTKWQNSSPQCDSIVYNPLPVFADPNSKKEKTLTIDRYVPISLVFRKDGGLLLFTEQQYIYQAGSVFGDSPSSGETDFVYQNILLISFNNDGKMEWTEMLHKEQFSTNDAARYSSFFLFKGKREIRLLFNDNISSDAAILEYIIDGKGNVARNILPHHKKEYKIILELNNSLQISTTQFLTLSQSTSFTNKDLYLSKISY